MKKRIMIIYSILFLLFGAIPLAKAEIKEEVVSTDTAYCDVVVVGGGTAGVPAAIQSGRAGAKTILIESGPQLGGVAVVAGVAFPSTFYVWGKQIIAGIGWEWVSKTIELETGKLPDLTKPVPKGGHPLPLNPLLYSLIAEEMCQKAGVEIRYFEAPLKTTALKNQKDFYKWRILTASQSEARTIFCKQIIDCTGNGTVCDLAGAERMREDTVMPGTLYYGINTGLNPDKIDMKDLEKRFQESLSRGEVRDYDAFGGIKRYLTVGSSNKDYVYQADNSTGKLRTDTNLRGRQSVMRMLRFFHSVPGGEKAKLVRLLPEVGIRETWRIKGRYIITVEDYRNGKHWDDSVALAYYPIDMHENKTGVKPKHLAPGVVATIPLRAMLPAGVDNILAAGRHISSDRFANSALRVQATCMAGGQAAGAAAALAAQKNIAPHQVKIDELKALLKKHQAIVP